MKSCVVALALLAVALYEAQPATTMKHRIRVPMRSPAVILWVQFDAHANITGDATIGLELGKLKLNVPSQPELNRWIKGSYDETKGCIVGGFAPKQNDTTDGALIYKQESMVFEGSNNRISPVDAPIKPFIGQLEDGATETVPGRTTTFEECYKYGVEKGANGVQWHRSNRECVAHFGDNIKMSNGDFADYRSQIFNPPIAYFGTTEERIRFASLPSLNDCVDDARKQRLNAKFVTFESHSRQCFHATTGDIISTNDDADHFWTVRQPNLSAPKFTFGENVSCTKV